MNAALDNALKYNQQRDSNSNSPWYKYQSQGIWHQCWYEDELSLAMRFDYIISANIAGPGFWALGYEGNNAAIWKIIKQKFNRQ